jgi:hypothetical protein
MLTTSLGTETWRRAEPGRQSRETVRIGTAAKADKFIGAHMPDQEHGPGIIAIVCLVAVYLRPGRLDSVGESVLDSPPGRTLINWRDGKLCQRKRQRLQK